MSPDILYDLIACYLITPDNGNPNWFQGVVENSDPAAFERWSDSIEGTTRRYPPLNSKGPLKAVTNAVPGPETDILAIAGLACGAVIGGKPKIKGTRIGVGLILERLGEGWTVEQLIQSYPRITAEQIHACQGCAGDARDG